MKFRESETLELKRIVVDDIKKEIIAFANTDGGEIYVGIEDDGAVTRLDNVDEASLQVTNMVRETIKPDLTMFVHYEALEIEAKQVLKISVQRGTKRPYYLAKKGLRPEGVYVRQGNSAAPASDSAILKMIKESSGETFEGIRSARQELTFQTAASEFAKRGVEFGEAQMKTLGIWGSDGLYTNLGLLLSDECAHTIKLAVFQGADQSVFKDRAEFSGSLLAQLNEAYSYIDRFNSTQATFEKLLRIDSRDYPEMALREALLNVIVHRDYAFKASSLISIYDDRIEFVSIGGLVPGIEREDLEMGISVCRNPNLADVFYRLKLIEAYGTGIKKIMTAYEASEQKPLIETSPNAFRLTLPNTHAAAKTQTVYQVSEPGEENETEESAVLKLAKRNGCITRTAVEELLKTSPSTATRFLRKLVENGELIPKGAGRSTKYVPKS